MKKYLLTALLFITLSGAVKSQCPPNALAFASVYPQCPDGCGVLLRDWPEGVLVNIYGGDPLSIITSVAIPGVLGGSGVGNAFVCVPCNIPLVFASTLPGATSGCVIVYLGVLPITLTDFTASSGNGRAPVISWTAATDTRNVTYTVQRSEGEAAFTDISTINARGGYAQRYQYTDLSAGSGNIRYRIRYQDGTGDVSYSAIKSVKIGMGNSFGGIFPNPSRNSFKIQVNPVALPATARLINSQGQTVASIIINNPVTEFGNQLGRGVYALRLTDKNHNSQTQILVKE